MQHRKSIVSLGRAMAQAILITGTPATGKTTLAHALSYACHLPVLDVQAFAKAHHLFCSYDRQRNAHILDEKKFAKTLETYLQRIKSYPLILVETHIAHFLTPKSTYACIVTNCSLPLLKKRLKQRGYSGAKVRENLDAEIFQVCAIEALELGHRPLYCNTDTKKAMYGFIRHFKAILPKIDI
ncbi:MAG: AAA family ATPase [Candidatus Woesearchaeota archaeon]